MAKGLRFILSGDGEYRLEISLIEPEDGGLSFNVSLFLGEHLVLDAGSIKREVCILVGDCARADTFALWICCLKGV